MGTAFHRQIRQIAICAACVLGMPSMVLGSPAGGNSVGREEGESAQSRKSNSGKKRQKITRSAKAFETAVQQMIEAYQRDQFASALANCHHAMEVMPDDTASKLRSGVMMMCLELMDKNEKHEDVLELAQKIRQLDIPEDTVRGLCFMEATSLTKLHRWQAARDKYAQCPGKTAEEQAVIESNMAELDMIEGDSASAVTMYQSSLAHDDTNPHAAFGLAVAYARTEQMQAAHRAFLTGVTLDPGFTFLKDAFFEPVAENDFQTAFRMIGLRRLPEARFYLERYVSAEQRPVYKGLGQTWLDKISDRIASHRELRIAQYPVLLEHVRSIAINNSGSYMAFLTVEKSAEHDFSTVLWILDTRHGKTHRRLVLPKTMISDMTFIGQDNTLRLLGVECRYELDAAANGGYYLYENPSNVFPLFLTSNGEKIGAMRDDLSIALISWSDAAQIEGTAWKSSVNISQMRISSSAQAIAYTSLGTHFETASDSERRTLAPRFEIHEIAAHPQAEVFALGMRTGTLLVDVKGNLLDILGSPGQTPVNAVAFSPDGKKLAAFGEQTVEVWQTNAADEIVEPLI